VVENNPLADVQRPKRKPTREILNEIAKDVPPIEIMETKPIGLALADVEMSSDVSPAIRDPLARIGFDPSKVATVPKQIGDSRGSFRGAYFQQSVPHVVEDMLHHFQPKKDVIAVFPLSLEAGRKQHARTLAHEATHRGFQILRNQGLISGTYPTLTDNNVTLNEEVFIRLLDWMVEEGAEKERTATWINDNFVATPESMLKDKRVRTFIENFFNIANNYLKRNGRPTVDVELPIPGKEKEETE